MLKRIQLKGFKSIKSMDLELRALNVMIGANGSGKSNLISYFKMLNTMMNRNGGIPKFVMDSGYAQSLLHYGSGVTSLIEGAAEYENKDASYRYEHTLRVVPVDQLGFETESFEYRPNGGGGWSGISRGQQDTELDKWPSKGRPEASVIAAVFKSARPYHFDDTSTTCGCRQTVYSGEFHSLAPNGRNLAAVLAGLQRSSANTYTQIVATIRLIAPYFGNFDVKAEGHSVVLNWYEKNSEVLFGPHQISDGTLRAMCLITLLLLPDDQLPSIIIVDEPELGLHPYAISVIASLFKSAAERTQVLVSTQSTAFLDHFEPEDIIIVDRVGKESRFSRPDAAHFKEWLEDYTVSQVWEKNVFGGGPH